MTKKQIVEILIVFALLAAGAFYMEHGDKEIGTGGIVQRNAYGDGSREIDLLVNADGILEDYSYTLTVEERNLPEEEAKEYFERAKREIDASFCCEGQNIDHVSRQVNIETAYAQNMVKADWQFSDYFYIDEDGVLADDNLSPQGTLIDVEAELSCGTYRESYCFSFMAYPETLEGEQLLIKQIDTYVNKQQSEEETDYLTLPDSVGGVKLSWSEKKEHLVLKVLLLEGFLLFLFPLIQRSRQRDARKKYESSLLLDYPEMVSKFNVLVGAGMTIKQAWNIISAQYLDKRKKNAIPEMPAFEEMARTWREICDGESEKIAYQRFADRIRMAPYHRFVRLLINNLQKGNSGLCMLLEQESERAFAERRMHAKKLGEEASTKLLFPMILMLGIVMAITMVPAISEFKM
ncbi:MAG: secretion system protein F [Agathobacter sp.]|nr:secretion system protein F [Agathobacter sp.]